MFFCSGCLGHQCTLTAGPGHAACVLKNLGIAVDPKNETKKENCGLDPENAAIMEPFPLPHSTNGGCLVGLPPDVSFHTLYKCDHGKIRSALMLTFPTSIKKNFSCIYNPTCINGFYNSHVVCFMGDFVIKNARSASDKRSVNIPTSLMISYMIWLWILR